MDLDKFYGLAPKPRASRRTILDPARSKAMIVNEGNSKRILFTTSDDGPVSLSTPEMKSSKSVTISDFDAMIDQIFDMV